MSKAASASIASAPKVVVGSTAPVLVVGGSAHDCDVVLAMTYHDQHSNTIFNSHYHINR